MIFAFEILDRRACFRLYVDIIYILYVHISRKCTNTVASAIAIKTNEPAGRHFARKASNDWKNERGSYFMLFYTCVSSIEWRCSSFRYMYTHIECIHVIWCRFYVSSPNNKKHLLYIFVIIYLWYLSFGTFLYIISVIIFKFSMNNFCTMRTEYYSSINE